MTGTEVLDSLKVRCGGAVDIGVWGNEETLDNFLQGTDGDYFSRKKCCAVNVFVEGNDSDADGTEFFAATEGRPRAVAYSGGKERAEELALRFGCPAADVQGGMDDLLYTLLTECKIKRIDVDIPGWTQVMPQENSAIAELLSAVTECSSKIEKMGGVDSLNGVFDGAKYWEKCELQADYGTGIVKIKAEARSGIYYQMLSEIAGDSIDGEYTLMRFVRSAAEAKRGYAKIKDALECAAVNGYGIVQPSQEDIVYDSPAVVRRGGNVGIRLKASAPSYHIIRVDVAGEVNPVMGSAAQSESMVQGMMGGFERNPEEMWNTDIFGKTLKSMVQECLAAKVSLVQEDTRTKLRRAVTRMVNEGKGGAIVIIL